MIKTNELQVVNEFEVFADVSMPVSIKGSMEQAVLQLDEQAIQQVLLTIISHNGKVSMPKVHNWAVDNVTEIDEDGVHVFADLELAVSIKINARDGAEAMKKAELLIGEYAVEQAILTLVLANGRVVTVDVHDWIVKLGGVFGEDEY